MASRMVRLTVVLHASSTSRARELLEALRFLVTGTRLVPACLGCFAWTDPDGSLHYIEEWATETDIRRRVRSDHFTHLLSILECAQEPEVHFDFVTTTRGLDYVEEVRGDLVNGESQGTPR